jgi:hypothetical protein
MVRIYVEKCVKCEWRLADRQSWFRCCDDGEWKSADRVFIRKIHLTKKSRSRKGDVCSRHYTYP